MAYFYDSFMEHRRKQWLRSIHAVEVSAYQQRVIEKVSQQGVLVKLTIPIYEVIT